MKMTRATRKAVELRSKLGLYGQVDAEAVANVLGLTVVSLKLEVLQELTVDDYIGVAERLVPAWRRWVVAHAVGHKVLHPGNHLWMRMHTGLGGKVEREAEDFAHALLMDAREAVEEGLSETWEIAEHFGVPEDLVFLQAPLTARRDWPMGER